MKLRSAQLTQRAGALRVSLLLSLGLAPVVACGGSVVSSQPDETAGKAGSGNAGAGASAGSSSGGSSPTAGYGGNTVGAGAGSVYPYCDRPVVNPVSGIVLCQNGFEHRPTAVACKPPPVIGIGGSSGEGGADGEGGEGGTCERDSECAHLTLGYCDLGSNFGGEGTIAPHCASGCLQDSDCGKNQLCICDGSSSGGKCVSARCTVDADCGPNQFCATTRDVCGGSYYSCTSLLDECYSDANCDQMQPCFGGNHRTCGGDAVCGRPFLVEEAPRFADIEPRSDWLDVSLKPDLSGLSALQRAELAAHWSRLGQMEHASIAAFARFNLQLLALGAPAELVQACNKALIDETAHAKLCFAFASAYAGSPLGPSKLDMSQCFEETTLFSVAKLVIAEGCIGETVAALEASEEAERTRDPVVKQALLRIACDERNHAELAYRFVRWALSQCSAAERAALLLEAERCVTGFETGAQRVEQRAAAQLVVRPLLDALHTLGNETEVA